MLGYNRRLPRLAALVSTTLWLGACSGGLSPDIASELAPSEGAAGKPQFTPFNQSAAPQLTERVVIANPSLAEVMKSGPLGERWLGREDAPVTVIKYASMTCPYCKRFMAEVFPTFKKEYIDTGKVRFILREFPIGHQSGQATVALRCAPTDKHFALYEKLMAQQASWVSQEVRLDPIYAVAKQVGMSRPEFDACLANRDLVEGLKWVKDRGRTLGVIGTPNFFVDGKLVKKVLTLPEIRQLVDEALARKLAAGAANGPAAR
jgi:protein-disulfide isomerase